VGFLGWGFCCLDFEMLVLLVLVALVGWLGWFPSVGGLVGKEIIVPYGVECNLVDICLIFG